MYWAILLCALGAGVSALVALACNKQYQAFKNSDSGWLEYWLAARSAFIIATGLFIILLVVVVALNL